MQRRWLCLVLLFCGIPLLGEATCVVRIPDVVTTVGALVKVPIIITEAPVVFETAGLDVLFSSAYIDSLGMEDMAGTCTRSEQNGARDRYWCRDISRGETFGSDSTRRLLDIKFRAVRRGSTVVLPAQFAGALRGCLVQPGFVEVQ